MLENIIQFLISDKASSTIERLFGFISFKAALAIIKASNLAQKGDIILILGKGHEDYQEIEGERKPFNDYKLLTKILQ